MGSPLIWGGNGALNLQQGGINLQNGDQLRNNGAKNYLVNPVAETGTTTGWSLGNVTLTSNLPTGTPTFGSGASGNLALTATSTTPLSGAYSFSYASSAATTAGNFLASDAFTVDTADLGKVLSFSFYYKATSNPSNGNWSGTTSNSFAVAIYDVTAGGANWLIPVGIFNIIQSSGTGICSGSFQSSVTAGQQYRIVIYNANATAGAITLYFDQFVLGPAAFTSANSPVVARAHVSSGASTTSGNPFNFDVVDYDTTGSISTGATTWKFTAPVTGYYNVTCDLYLGATSTNLAVYKNASVFAGFITSISGANPGGGSTIVYCNAGDTLDIRSPNATATPASLSGLSVAQCNHVSIFLIQSSGVGPAGQVVAASYWVSSNFAASSTTPINFDSKEFDTNLAVTTSSTAWKFTAPVTGYYQITAGGLATGGSGTTLIAYKNGTKYKVLGGIAPTSGSAGAACGVIFLNSGDYLDFRPNISCTFSGGALNTDPTTTINIALIQGPSSPAQSGTMTYGVAQNSTSGTAIDFVNIPAGINQLTVAFFQVSTNGTTVPQIQFTTAAGNITTGYAVIGTGFGSGASSNSYTTGFSLGDTAAAGNALSGTMVFTRVSGNNWIGQGVMYRASTPTGIICAGSIALSATLTGIHIHAGGTDTFDAGIINISYQ